MNAFEYLSVFISIVLGLGLAQLLLGFARWLELRVKVKAYLPAIAWAAFLLLVHVQSWWAMFGMRQWTDWTFLQFSIVLLQPILLFLMSSLALLGQAATEPDLRVNFFTHRHWFFGLLLAVLVVSIAKDLVRSGALPSPENLAFHGALFATAALALATRKDVAHHILSVVALVIIIAYVVLMFAELA